MAHVSICIPAYNNVISVKRLLDSIMRQNYTDYEVILTDDSTNQEIEMLLKNYSSLPMTYKKNTAQLGPTANTNASIALASGDYIKVMHHDDSFAREDSLDRLVHMLDENPQAVIAFCGTRETYYQPDESVDEEKSYTRCMSELEKGQLDCDYHNLFLVNMIGAPSATIFRRESRNFQNDLKWLVDIEFYMHLFETNFCYEWTKEPLINIGISATQVTRSCLADQKLILLENKKVFLDYELYQQKIYRKHLIRLNIGFGFPYSTLAGCHIPRHEYWNHLIRMKGRKLLKKKEN